MEIESMSLMKQSKLVLIYSFPHDQIVAEKENLTLRQVLGETHAPPDKLTPDRQSTFVKAWLGFRRRVCPVFLGWSEQGA